MRLTGLNRRVHYWASAIVALPLLVIVASGILLQLKKQWQWIQPAEQRGVGTVPAIGFDEILAAVQSVPHLEVDGWDHVSRLDVRPGRGLVKVWLASGWEVQIDLDSGRVLQSAFRRSDLIESIHDGSFFAGDLSKLGLFLPTGVVLLLLWATGLWLFVVPLLIQRRRKHLERVLSAQASSDSSG